MSFFILIFRVFPDFPFFFDFVSIYKNAIFLCICGYVDSSKYNGLNIELVNGKDNIIIPVFIRSQIIDLYKGFQLLGNTTFEYVYPIP